MIEATINVKAAARIMNMQPQALQSWIRYGTCPFGYFFKVHENFTRGNYVIIRKQLEDCVGSEAVKKGLSAGEVEQSDR